MTPLASDKTSHSTGASERRPRIAITLGDPRGIGPEVAVHAARHSEARADLVLIGPEGVAETEGLELIPVGHWQANGTAKEAGRLSVEAVERAVSMASVGEIDGIVTAPISKPAVVAAGYEWPGHTEMLRDMAGSPRTALCMTTESTGADDPLRVVLVTGHMPLRDVVAAYTLERLSEVARLARDDLIRWWGLEAPRLAVCAINPHASDDGLFGDEEERVCAPAVTRLRDEGIDVRGPFAADTVFAHSMRGKFDAVLTPYHDIGMTAIKTSGFGLAVNVTLGLPFARTSPDHGTAFDIAGTGSADPSSMSAALKLAVTFAKRL